MRAVFVGAVAGGLIGLIASGLEVRVCGPVFWLGEAAYTAGVFVGAFVVGRGER